MGVNKTLVLVLLLLTSLVVVGCQGQETSTSPPAEPAVMNEVEEVAEEVAEVEIVELEEPAAEEELAVADESDLVLGMLDPEASLAKDQEAPDFALKTLSGDVVKLSDYRGKLVLLNFWTTY